MSASLLGAAMHLPIVQADERLTGGMQQAGHKWPAIRAWGNTTPECLDRWAANMGRSEGATAGKAVLFPCAARRSFVGPLVAFVWLFLLMPSSTGTADRAVLVTALVLESPFAHGQQPAQHRISE
jgi:hypothetical protein